jgi:hypothetical protein
LKAFLQFILFNLKEFDELIPTNGNVVHSVSIYCTPSPLRYALT